MFDLQKHTQRKGMSYFDEQIKAITPSMLQNLQFLSKHININLLSRNCLLMNILKEYLTVTHET